MRIRADKVRVGQRWVWPPCGCELERINDIVNGLNCIESKIVTKCPHECSMTKQTKHRSTPVLCSVWNLVEVDVLTTELSEAFG